MFRIVMFAVRLFFLFEEPVLLSINLLVLPQVSTDDDQAFAVCAHLKLASIVVCGRLRNISLPGNPHSLDDFTSRRIIWGSFYFDVRSSRRAPVVACFVSCGVPDLRSQHPAWQTVSKFFLSSLWQRLCHFPLLSDNLGGARQVCLRAISICGEVPACTPLSGKVYDGRCVVEGKSLDEVDADGY